MDTVKYELKLFLDDAADVELEEFIPVFHDWIQTQQLEELLIDVADYRHVPQGPGVVLIAHDAHYVMDRADERLGLLYSRRRETHPSRCTIQSVEDRLRSVWHCALTACQRLEAHPVLHGRLQFRSTELLLRCNDRLRAPNTTAAYDELCQYLEPFLATLYPSQRVEVEHLRESTSRLTVTIKVPEPLDVDTLLTRLT
jgi:hypothetical protein